MNGKFAYTSKMFEVEVTEGGAELVERLAGDWARLCAEGMCNDPFLRPEWFTALTRHFSMPLEVFTLRRHGRIEAILPVAYGRGHIHGLPARKMNAAFNLNSQRFDLVHTPDETIRRQLLRELWQSIRSRQGWDVLEFRLVRDEAWLADLVRTAEQDGFLTGTWPMGSAPYISVPKPDANGSIDQFFSGPRKKFAKDLERRYRRLAEIGSVRVERSNDYSAKLIDQYLQLEQAGWKGRAGTAAVQDPRAAALHHDFAKAVAATRDLAAYQLWFDDLLIAMNINVRGGGRLVHWKTSYNEDFSRFSPGNLLFRELLADAAREGIDEIDLLCPEVPYKREWATGSREHSALFVFRPSFLGRLAHLWKFGVFGRLRELRRLQPRVAGLLASRP
jgi:CelD/BcsL family acetyltransferase involved in cellulose biosynthesis